MTQKTARRREKAGTAQKEVGSCRCKAAAWRHGSEVTDLAEHGRRDRLAREAAGDAGTGPQSGLQEAMAGRLLQRSMECREVGG